MREGYVRIGEDSGGTDNERVASLCRNLDMGIGVFFEIPNTAASNLREISASEEIRIRIENPESPAAESYPGLYIFCSLLGRIQGRWRTSGDVSVFWLTFPRNHALIPLLWPFDFYLVRRVEQILLRLGAHRIDPKILIAPE